MECSLPNQVSHSPALFQRRDESWLFSEPKNPIITLASEFVVTSNCDCSLFQCSRIEGGCGIPGAIRRRGKENGYYGLFVAGVSAGKASAQGFSSDKSPLV